MNRNKKLNQKKIVIGCMFLLPAFVMIAFTLIIPVCWNMVLSFMKWNGASAMEFVGLENYVKVFTTRASVHAIKNSCIIAGVSIVVSMVVGMAMALMIYRVTSIEGAIFRFIYYSPAMLPMTVVGLLFTFVFAMDDGILNNLLRVFGLGELTQAWLSTKTLSVVCIGLVQGWRFSGTVMMLIYTAIVAVPNDLFEELKLAGATYRQEVKYVILPLVQPTTVLTLSMLCMWTFKSYTIVKSMTNGGPGDLTMAAPMYIIKRAFWGSDFGFAAANSIVFSVLILTCIIIVRTRLGGEKIEY